MTGTRFELAWDAKCVVGESPVWDAANRRLLFVDVHRGLIMAYGVDDGRRQSWEIGKTVGSFGLCRSGRLIVALQDSIAFFDPSRGVLETLVENVGEPPPSRLNDGKVGPDGCFWVGGLDTRPIPEKELICGLYRITPDGKVERKADGYMTSNGLAWTPDGGTMFHSDTTPGIINAWDFDKATGSISRRRRIASLTFEDGRPDGGACDAEGCYWSAGYTSGRLNRFSATGMLLDVVVTPTPAPTMPCFVEQWLYVTSLRRRLTDDVLAQFPDAGGLFRTLAPIRGAAVTLFADA